MKGNLVRLKAGDTVVADGRLADAQDLSIDASVLTGETDPVALHAGDELRSGSIAVEGGGAYVVEAVGPDSYAERVADEAREFRHPRSPLERAINCLRYWLVGIMLVLGAILGYALYRRDAGVSDAVSAATAAVLSLVDVICTDKTGSLTEAALTVVDVLSAADDGRDALVGALARYAASAGAQQHPGSDRGGVPGWPGTGRAARPVLLAAPLERAGAPRRNARARGPGAL
ncbi:MAG TPA: hypothetical protein VMU39_10225 [Solirubrobacteraceae bacterium]|nr:hypothetical protein [Solirubrobacteraceae bacterium]